MKYDRQFISGKIYYRTRLKAELNCREGDCVYFTHNKGYYVDNKKPSFYNKLKDFIKMWGR